MTWRAWCPDFGETEDDAVSVEAPDPLGAAEEYAACTHREDPATGIDGIVVNVRDGATVRRFAIEAQPVMSIQARAATE